MPPTVMVPPQRGPSMPPRNRHYHPPFPRPPIRPNGWLRGLAEKQNPSSFSRDGTQETIVKKKNDQCIGVELKKN